MKNTIFLLGALLAAFTQSAAADNRVSPDTSEIFSGQDVRVAALSADEMKRTEGAFLNFADFGSIINSQVSNPTAIANGLVAVSIATSNNIAVNTVINAPVYVSPVNIAPININVGTWHRSTH